MVILSLEKDPLYTCIVITKTLLFVIIIFCIGSSISTIPITLTRLKTMLNESEIQLKGVQDETSVKAYSGIDHNPFGYNCTSPLECHNNLYAIEHLQRGLMISASAIMFLVYSLGIFAVWDERRITCMVFAIFVTLTLMMRIKGNLNFMAVTSTLLDGTFDCLLYLFVYLLKQERDDIINMVRHY